MGPACPEHPLQEKRAHVLYPDVARVLRDLQESVLQALQTESG